MFSKFERYILCFIITVYLFAFLKYLLGDIFVYTLPVINYEEGISISREFDVEQFREFSLELQREISEERRLMISQELSNFYRNLTIQHRIEIIQQHQAEIQYLSRNNSVDSNIISSSALEQGAIVIDNSWQKMSGYIVSGVLAGYLVAKFIF